MRELLLTIAITLASLAMIDLGLSYWLAQSIAEEKSEVVRNETFAQLAARQLDAFSLDKQARFDKILKRWRSLPKEKEDAELRVFLVGNSTAIFSLVPERVERGLARALPERRPVVISLLISNIKVDDEAVLVDAAIAQGADVVLLTPNIKGLRAGPSERSDAIKTDFHLRPVGAAQPRSLADRLRDHWRLYRERERIRGPNLGRGSSVDGRS